MRNVYRILARKRKNANLEMDDLFLHVCVLRLGLFTQALILL
jgi:hypothetical protein